MLRVTQSKDEIIIREIPVVESIRFLALIVFLSIPIFISYSSNKNISEQFWLLGIGVGAVICLILLLTRSVTTTKINKPGQTVSVRKQSLIKYNFNVYSFNEIAGLIYVDGIGSKTVQLMMPLKDGRKIELSITDGSSTKQCFDAASLLNSYIFDTPKQISYKPAIFDDD